MKRLFTTIIITSICLWASIAWCRIILVPTPKYPTIQAGIDAALDGDTVLVADGTYTGYGNRDLNFGGKAITVTSENGAENCIIDCEGTYDDQHRGFYFGSGESEASVVSGFTIRNGYTNDYNGGGGILCYNSSPTISDNIISGSQTYYFGGGISLWGSSSKIFNNIITGNGYEYNIGGGIACTDSSPLITNNTISGNRNDGIRLYGNSSPIITNTILWNDSPEEIDVVAPATVTVTYSDIQGGWVGEGNIDADPLFVDPTNGDYHLQTDSPCIDTGTAVGAPPDDIEGNPRDEYPDMGAYEYQGGATTGSINGTVNDARGIPLGHALVIAINHETLQTTEASTDADGYYEMADLAPGSYLLLCLARRHKHAVRTAMIISGESITVDFRLRRLPPPTPSSTFLHEEAEG